MGMEATSRRCVKIPEDAQHLNLSTFGLNEHLQQKQADDVPEESEAFDLRISWPSVALEGFDSPLTATCLT